ncbi:hypothetical protein [Xenophilus sp. Marseille-Q4582]|uniref:hypothetical protein n=1 Tax=Xenophilus sp. Marseille-Q4582 TaxID=2866600 RepID=UPI001CE3E463|nr:hypothetical protein [Xenophilus sp. Marseille-Q4582]
MTDKAYPEPSPLMRAFQAFMADYELRGEDDDGREGCYRQYETERPLIEDFVWGLMEDDDWIAASRNAAGSGISDEQIAALRDKHGITSSGRGIRAFDQIRNFVHAVLAMAPAPTQAQEPVAEVENDYNADGMSSRITTRLPAGTKLFAAPQHSTAEPFGYFRADSFGWTDCAATDDGAVALYEAAPQQAPLTDEQIEAIGLKVLLKESDGLKKDRPAFGFSTVEGIIRAAEEIHGIGAAKETR